MTVRNSRHTILLAEDDHDAVVLFERALKTAHIPASLQVVANGQEAINYLAGAGEFENRSTYPVPDLLFLDLKMPLMNGFDVLEWLHANGSSVRTPPVCALSNSGSQEDQQKALDLGAAAFFVKPLDQATLVFFVDEACGTYLVNEPDPPGLQ